MKFFKWLEEARRNPEKNPKIGVIDTLEKYKDRDDVYISFTDINKLGIKPMSHYNTPLGIYSYPLKEMWIKGVNIKYKRFKGKPSPITNKELDAAGEVFHYFKFITGEKIRKLTDKEFKDIIQGTDLEEVEVRKLFSELMGKGYV